MIKMKIYRRGKETLVAACDSNLIGKTFREGEVRLHVSSFYDGDYVTGEQLLNHLRIATIANLVGKETIKLALEAGLIEKEGIITIQRVPHAQMVLI